MRRRLLFLFSLSLGVGLVSGSLAEAGLVAHWTFDDGTASDVSGYGTAADGTFVNGASVVNDTQKGKVLDLNRSSSQHVNCGSDAKFDVTAAITLAAWVKTDMADLVAARPCRLFHARIRKAPQERGPTRW